MQFPPADPSPATSAFAASVAARAPRLLVENSGYELKNLGDIAMLQVAIKRVRHRWPGARVQVVTAQPDVLAQHVPGVEPLVYESPRELGLLEDSQSFIAKLAGVLPAAVGRGMRSAERRAWNRLPIPARRRDDYASLSPMTEAITHADLVLATGGGFLTDAFHAHAYQVLRVMRAALRGGVPIALVGQGIGPLEDVSLRKLTGGVLRRAIMVGLREHVGGVPLCKQLGVPNDCVAVTGDDAIECALADNLPPDMPRRSIGINVRAADYAGVDAALAATIVSVVSDVAAVGRVPIAPLPVTFSDADSDHQLLASLAATGNQPAEFPQPRTPAELIARIAACRVVVTGSYHAGVFALARGVPVVALVGLPYYAAKFAGLRQQFGNAGCEMLDIRAPGLAARLRAAIDRAGSTPSPVREGLVLAARAQQRASEAAYGRIFDFVDRRLPANELR